MIPDNHINKELKARLNNLDVDGTAFKFFDSRATSSRSKNYFLLSTQLNGSRRTKCGKGWLNSTEIQVVVIHPLNTGSKALMNRATEELLNEIDDFSLPVGSGFTVNGVETYIANEIVQNEDSNVVYRKIVRMETTIN